MKIVIQIRIPPERIHQINAPEKNAEEATNRWGRMLSEKNPDMPIYFQTGPPHYQRKKTNPQLPIRQQRNSNEKEVGIYLLDQSQKGFFRGTVWKTLKFLESALGKKH